MMWFMFAIGLAGFFAAWVGGVQVVRGRPWLCPDWVSKIVATVWLVIWSGPAVAVLFGIMDYVPSAPECYNRNMSGCFQWRQ